MNREQGFLLSQFECLDLVSRLQNGESIHPKELEYIKDAILDNLDAEKVEGTEGFFSNAYNRINSSLFLSVDRLKARADKLDDHISSLSPKMKPSDMHIQLTTRQAELLSLGTSAVPEFTNIRKFGAQLKNYYKPDVAYGIAYRYSVAFSKFAIKAAKTDIDSALKEIMNPAVAQNAMELTTLLNLREFNSSKTETVYRGPELIGHKQMELIVPKETDDFKGRVFPTLKPSALNNNFETEILAPNIGHIRQDIRDLKGILEILSKYDSLDEFKNKVSEVVAASQKRNTSEETSNLSSLDRQLLSFMISRSHSTIMNSFSYMEDLYVLGVNVAETGLDVFEKAIKNLKEPKPHA